MARQLGHRTVFDGVLTAATPIDVEANSDAIGARFTLGATTVGTSLDVEIQQHDPSSDTYLPIEGGQMTSLAAPGSTDLTIYPGIFVLTGRLVNGVLTSRLRLVVTPVGSSTFTLGIDWLG